MLADLIPHDTLTIYEADEAQGLLTPVLARDQYAAEIMRTPIRFEEGITGWAARHARLRSPTRRTSAASTSGCSKRSKTRVQRTARSRC